MFDGVGRGSIGSTRRQGTALLLSISSVAGLFLLLYQVTSRPVEEIAVREEVIEVPVRLVAPPAPLAGGSAGSPKKAPDRPKPRSPDVPVAPQPLPADAPPAPDASDTPDAPDAPDGGAGGAGGPGVPDGTPDGTPDGKPGGVKGGRGTGPGVSTVYFRDVQVKTQPPKPEYPEAARQMRMEDRCVIRIRIDEQGVPYEAEAKTCPEVFREVSLASARASRFYPYLVDGAATPVQFDWTFNFRLK